MRRAKEGRTDEIVVAEWLPCSGSFCVLATHSELFLPPHSTQPQAEVVSPDWARTQVTGLYILHKLQQAPFSSIPGWNHAVPAALGFKAKFHLWKSLAHLDGERKTATTTLTHFPAAL